MESNITSATSSGIPPGFGCRSRTSFLGKTCICRSDFLSSADVLTSTRMNSASTDTFPKKTSEDAKENIFNVGSTKRPTFFLVFVGASRDYTSAWWSTTNSCGAFDKHSYHPILAIHRPLLVLKALANENTLLRTHCCRHKCFPVCARATFVADTKNVSDFVQKHFVSSTNVSQFAQSEKHHEQQCVRNNVSSFASTFRDRH